MTAGSGIGTEAVSCGDGATKRLKSGKEKLGKERRLKSGKEKFGKEKRLKSGEEKLGKKLAVAAPMTAKADKDTTIAGTRLEARCRAAASGWLSPCVSLSGVSATCVPYVSAPSQDLSSPPIRKQKEPSRGRSSGDSRAMAHPNSA